MQIQKHDEMSPQKSLYRDDDYDDGPPGLSTN